MKTLIAAACVCVIGLTGWFALNEYNKQKRGAFIAMSVKCNNMLDEEWREANYSNTTAGQKLLDLDLDKCIDFEMNGVSAIGWW